MANFQMIEAHAVDIENFTYDVSDMIDSIYIGPQGELLEELQTFNDNYGCDLSITKSFTLKPGGYDQIKKAHARWVMRYDMRPRGIKSIFDRIAQYRWRADPFKNHILSVESKMKELKGTGMRWQDNTDQFQVELERLKSSIISALDETRNMYPDIEIECKMMPVNESRTTRRRRSYWHATNSFPADMFEAENPVDFIILFYTKIKNASMMVHIMGDNDTISEYRVPMGDVYIASGTYLLPLISRHWGRTVNPDLHVASNTHSFFIEAMYLSPMRFSEHPYIGQSTDKYLWNLKGTVNTGNICMGNMQSDICKSLLNNQIMAHITHLRTWVTNYYVPQTHPLNRINRLRNRGDDIQFALWRADLNSTSTTVFAGKIAVEHDCDLGKNIYSAMHQYGRNFDNNSLYTDSTFRTDSIEYPLRIEEYLTSIQLEDMSCNNCSFKSTCMQWHTLQILFQDDLSPVGEGYLGMFYELNMFTRIVMPDDRTDTEIHFVEMIVDSAWREDVLSDYEHYIKVHSLCKYWAEINGESFVVLADRYRRRAYALWAMAKVDLIDLYERHYNKSEETGFSWTLDNIRYYRAESHELPTEDEAEEELAREQDVLVGDPEYDEWLRNNPPIVAEDDLTPEQRSIQWAIQNGGANNL